MSEPIRVYHEHLPILTDELIKSGNLSLMVLDISPFSAIEEQYGIHTYTLVRQQLFAVLAEQSGKDYRKEDMLALELEAFVALVKQPGTPARLEHMLKTGKPLRN